MLKMVTWISLGLSMIGALADLGSSDPSGAETAAEMAMVGRVLLAPAAEPAPENPAPRR